MSVVSSVLSRVSTRSSRPPIINVNPSSFMDNLFSIAFGLGLRFVVDTVSHQDFKLTGTLVGLWEGVILLHFTKKTPKSSDPYIAFAVRLCVDLWLTESVARLVLVLIWTGLGMILADITPALWSDVGLNRVWRRLRRDLYTITQMVPTVAFFPPQRTVRFSPSHAPSVIGEEDIDDAASDITATAHTPSAPAPVPPPDPILPPSRDARKRRVPGHYGFEYSDTETERSFGFTPPRAAGGRTSRRQSLYPAQAPYDESLSSITPTEDVDAANLSDGVSSSAGTERLGPSSTSIINMSEVQGMEEEAAAAAAAVAATAEAAVLPTIDTAVAAAVAAKDEGAGNRTPTQQPVWIPPTPSDSAAAWRLNRAREAANLDAGPSSAITPILPVPVRGALGERMAQIPDFLDEPLTEDWTDLGKSVTAAAGADPFIVTTTEAEAPAAVPAEAAAAEQDNNNTLLDPPAYDDGWPPASADAPTREYKTAADFDDIYGDEAPLQSAAPAAGETGDLLGDSVELAGADADNVWDNAAREAEQADAEAEAAMAAELARLEQEEHEAAAEAQRLAEEAAAAADALAKRIAEEEAAAAEAAKKDRKEKKRKDKEKKDADERRAKEEADEAVRQQKRAEEEAKEREEQERKEKELKEREERERKEEEAKEQKRVDAEAAAERRVQKQREKDEKQREKEEKRRAKEEQEARDRMEKEEAERKVKEEAERKVKEEQEEAERIEKERQEKEEFERLELEKERQEQEAAERQRQEEAEIAAAAAAALDAAFAQAMADAEAQATAMAAEQEQAAAATDALGYEDAAGEENLPVSTGFSPEPLVNLDDPEPVAESEPAAAAAPAYEESVVSDASALTPQDPRERVERMMILRAQMVEIQSQIDDLRAGGAGDESVQLRQMEKIMRKMVRQATRRYAAGIENAQYLNGFDDTSDLVTLENVHPSAVIKKVAEQIESLMSPSARSLHFSVQVAKKANDAKKQKPKIVEFIDEFNLTNYTTENAVNKKISEIDIPEEVFGTWLTEYRNLVAKRAQQEEDPEYAPWG